MQSALRGGMPGPLSRTQIAPSGRAKTSTVEAPASNAFAIKFPEDRLQKSLRERNDRKLADDDVGLVNVREDVTSGYGCVRRPCWPRASSSSVSTKVLHAACVFERDVDAVFTGGRQRLLGDHQPRPQLVRQQRDERLRLRIGACQSCELVGEATFLEKCSAHCLFPSNLVSSNATLLAMALASHQPI